MKNYTFLLCIAILPSFFYACNRSAQSDSENRVETDTLHADRNSAHTEDTASLSDLPYTVIYNTETDRFETKENESHPSPTTAENIIEALNARYAHIHIEIDRISNDTLYVNIPDASYLTQNIGTAGATSYLVEATYSFTTLPNVGVVNFAFAEGDHAVPGPYTRDSFHEFLK